MSWQQMVNLFPTSHCWVGWSFGRSDMLAYWWSDSSRPSDWRALASPGPRHLSSVGHQPAQSRIQSVQASVLFSDSFDTMNDRILFNMFPFSLQTCDHRSKILSTSSDINFLWFQLIFEKLWDVEARHCRNILSTHCEKKNSVAQEGWNRHVLLGTLTSIRWTNPKIPS